MRLDPVLLVELMAAAQAALEAEATKRAGSGGAQLDRAAQEALVVHVLRREFQRVDERRLAQGSSRLSSEDEAALTDRVVAMTVGLGPIDVLLAEEDVEEVHYTRFDHGFMLRSNGTREPVGERFWWSQPEQEVWLGHLARTAGRTERQFNAQSPLLVMRIGPGLRLAATRDVSQHTTFALRRNTMGAKVQLADLVGRGMFPEVLERFLLACMRSPEMRLVVDGATGAGKTTLVRALLGSLDPLVQVAIIEDTAEIDLYDEVLHPNVESWEERLPNNEGEGGISQGALVKHALRYRPEWLVLGEVRDSDAAVPMLKAMTHGQSSLTTVHAHSAVAALDKLALYLGTGEDRLPIDTAHHQLSQAIDFVVHLDRGPDGHRYIAEMAEVAGFDNGRCATNTIYTSSGGEGHTMQRVSMLHAERLAAAGFDVTELGGGWR